MNRTRYYNENYSKKIILNTKISYILGLKCFPKDSYTCLFESHFGSSQFENSVYSAKFGIGKQFGSLLALSYENGKLVLQNTLNQKLLAVSQLKNNAIFDICWIPNKPEIVSASAELGVDKWTFDEGRGQFTNIGSFYGHKKSVTSIAVNNWDPVSFSSGSRDSNIIVWDSRCLPNHKANEIQGAHFHYNPASKRPKRTKLSNKVSVGGVLYVDQNMLASIGTSDGCVKLWDLRKTYCNNKREPISLYTFDYPGHSSYNGYTSLSFSPNKNSLYVSCLDNSIYSYHLTYPLCQPVNIFNGSKIRTYYIKTCISQCGSYLLCPSDNDAFIWLTDVTYNSVDPVLPIAKLDHKRSLDLSTIAWSNDGFDTVATTSDDMKCHLFKVVHDDRTKRNEELSGEGVPLQSLYLRKPILNVKRNFVCHLRRTTLNSTVENSEVTNSPKLPKLKVPIKLVSTGSNSSVSSSSNNQPPDSNTIPIVSRDSAVISDKYPSHHIHSPIISNTDASNSINGSSTSAHLTSPSCSGIRREASTPQTSGVKMSFKTPSNTSEKRLMREWLYSSKSSALQITPKSTTDDKNLTASNKKKEVLKKRFSDLMGDDQENLLSENRQAKSPTRNVLTVADNTTKSAVKMLQYEEICESKSSDDIEGIKPLDGSSLSPFMNANGFDTITPIKVSMDGQTLKSPLANLPNFVMDGSSPHNRQEQPASMKRKENWLMSLSASKRKKINSKLATIDEEVTPKKR